MSNKRKKITAHKGGRTALIPQARVTPQEKAALEAERERLDLSASDWALLMLQYSRQVSPEQAAAWKVAYHDD